VADIHKILEGSFSPVDCLDNPKICSLVNTCPTRKLWAKLAESIKKTFGNQTLVDLIKK
jgi:DNA-binding IscR family transcriptional regulator